MTIVIVESPYTGDIEANRRYAIEACADCFKRGETPFASHLLYPQILDELNKAQREQGIEAGYRFWLVARKVVFYTDRGWSEGMTRARNRADFLGYPQEERQLADSEQKRSEPQPR